MSCQMNRKYSQDIDKDAFYLSFNSLLSKNASFAALTALPTFDILTVKLLMEFHISLPAS